MLASIVEIVEPGRKLSLDRGFLSISGPQGQGRVPLDDIEAVIASNPAVTCTGPALAALAARGAPVVICGANFAPAVFILPVNGHHAQGDRIEAQAAATKPTRKRLWSAIVRAKICAQAATLERAGKSSLALKSLVSRVRSGDPTNIEAQAAQRYLPALFGKDFTRRSEGNHVNAYLNYGYTVLRAAAARAIVAAGLHPSLGLHHKSKGDALRLADDLMEPFRPAVDLVARALQEDGAGPLAPSIKRRLAAVLHADYARADGVSTLSNVLARLAQSLAQVYLGERRDLVMPISPIPLPLREPEPLSGDDQ
jgi:CRISPR-associated protein Cas1